MLEVEDNSCFNEMLFSNFGFLFGDSEGEFVAAEIKWFIKSLLVSLDRCRSMCSLSLSCLAKLFPHRSQPKGLSPVWVLIWRLRCETLANFASQ